MVNVSNGFELRLYSSLAKVFANDAPSNYSTNLKLSAMYGETVSFQVSYLTDINFQRLWGQLKVNATIGIDLTLRRVRNIPGSIPKHYKTDDGYITTESGLFPDLLEPLNPSQLPLMSGEWQTIWIDAKISLAADLRNSFSLCIEGPNGEVLGAGGITIDVVPVELPALAIPHTRWFHTDCLANYYRIEVFSEKYWEIVENFAEYAVRHGINMLLMPTFTPPLDTAIGGERLTVQLVDVTVIGDKYSFGFEKLERWVKMCKKVGVVYYEIAHLFTQWGAKYAPKIMGNNKGEYVQLFGWDTDATGPEYANFLQQMLPALTAKLAELGIAEKCYFHISDEPTLENIEQYTAARKIVEPFLKGFKIMDALTDYNFFKQGVVSIPIPAVDHIEPFLDGDVSELWTYYCCVQSYEVPNLFFMQPSYRQRVLGALLFKYNIAGFLQWGYNFYNSVHSVYPINPFVTTDADGLFPSGDAFIVYPGEDGEPLASTRLMVAQETFNDLRAFRLLEKLAGRDFVLQLIDEGLDVPIKFNRFPQNEDWILTLRQRVNEEIMKRV